MMALSKPLVLGHRGASALAPENTMAAFQLARQLDADGVELDVQLSRDRIPVVIHDDTVDRTTDGHGRVRALTILDLKQLDAGSWKGDPFSGERIPTLAEVFDTLADWLGKVALPRRARRGFVNVELKTSSILGNGLERQVINLIVNRNLEERVILSSFNPLALYRARLLNPQIRRGLLYSPDLPPFLSRAWLRFLAAPRALHPEHTMVNARYSRWARSKHYDVNTWTVDSPEEAVRLASLGVHAIITNQPNVIREAVESWQPPEPTPRPRRQFPSARELLDRFARFLYDEE